MGDKYTRVMGKSTLTAFTSLNTCSSRASLNCSGFLVLASAIDTWDFEGDLDLGARVALATPLDHAFKMAGSGSTSRSTNDTSIESNGSSTLDRFGDFVDRHLRVIRVRFKR